MEENSRARESTIWSLCFCLLRGGLPTRHWTSKKRQKASSHSKNTLIVDIFVRKVSKYHVYFFSNHRYVDARFLNVLFWHCGIFFPHYAPKCVVTCIDEWNMVPVNMARIVVYFVNVIRPCLWYIYGMFVMEFFLKKNITHFHSRISIVT